MQGQTDNSYFEWVRLAEESAAKGDYETAANHTKRVAHYFMLNKDTARYREFIKKTGDFYRHAAERLQSSAEHLKTAIMYLKAAESYREGGDHASAEDCGLRVRNYYAIFVDNGLNNLHGLALDLKTLGDYFRGQDDLQKAIECYEAAAGKAVEEGKTMLAGGLYRDAGDCSSPLKDASRAAKNFALAAENFFKAQKHFEAAWNYNLAGFILISLKRFDEALTLAKKARRAYSQSVGDVPVLFKSLSRVCELLGERDHLTAETEWQKIRRKFKRNYVDIVDSCFLKAKETKS